MGIFRYQFEFVEFDFNQIFELDLKCWHPSISCHSNGRTVVMKLVTSFRTLRSGLNPFSADSIWFLKKLMLVQIPTDWWPVFALCGPDWTHFRLIRSDLKKKNWCWYKFQPTGDHSEPETGHKSLHSRTQSDWLVGPWMQLIWFGSRLSHVWTF